MALRVEVVEAKEVTALGVGRPDYAPEVAIGHQRTGLLQTRWNVEWPTWIAAETIAGLTIYTVPTGYILHIGSVVVSCDASLLQRADIYYLLNGVHHHLLPNFIFDTKGQIVLGPQTDLQAPAGSTVEVMMHNYDNETRFFWLNIQGYIERVA